MRNINRVLLFLLLMAGTLLLCTDKPTGPETDPAGPPPVPEGLTVTYDTLRGCAVLTWNPVAVEDLAGYVVYRNDTTSSEPLRINMRLLKDTVYIDTIFQDVMDTTDRAFAYRIKAQDINANQSIVYSNAGVVNACSPMNVRTVISMKLINTHDDTVAIITSYHNKTRKNVNLKWFTGNDNTIVKTLENTTLDGEDTLRRSWDDFTANMMHVAITDDGGTVWLDSISLNNRTGLLVVNAGNDTVIYPNDTANIHGTVTQPSGKIIRWEWKVGSGNWNETSGSDTFFTVRQNDKPVICSLAVIDEDGNQGLDAITIRSLPLVKGISSSWNHSLILDSNGTLWGCGENRDGQLGDGTKTDKSIPVVIMRDIQSMVAGYYHSLILKTDNTLWACGNNQYGQLGDGTTTDRLTPVQVMSNVRTMATGNYHSLILKTDNTLWACGNNQYGQLGDGTTTDRLTPVQVAIAINSVAAGFDFTLLLKLDNTLWGCGSNSEGAIGRGTYYSYSIPVEVTSGVKNITAGDRCSLFLKSDSTLWVTGYNMFQKLGIYSLRENIIAPVKVLSSNKNILAALGRFHSLLLESDNTVWACGVNSYGQLGDGTTSDRKTFGQTMSNVQNIAAGYEYSLFIKTDNTLWACGRNDKGQLGDGTTTERIVPVQIILPQLQP